MYSNTLYINMAEICFMIRDKVTNNFKDLAYLFIKDSYNGSIFTVFKFQLFIFHNLKSPLNFNFIIKNANCHGNA